MAGTGALLAKTPPALLLLAKTAPAPLLLVKTASSHSPAVILLAKEVPGGPRVGKGGQLVYKHF